MGSWGCEVGGGGAPDTPRIRHPNHTQPLGNRQKTLTHGLGIKHAYSNIQKISPPKTENFQIKNSDIFHISAQNIDCGYSLEPPQQGSSNE